MRRKGVARMDFCVEVSARQLPVSIDSHKVVFVIIFSFRAAKGGKAAAKAPGGAKPSDVISPIFTRVVQNTFCLSRDLPIIVTLLAIILTSRVCRPGD